MASDEIQVDSIRMIQRTRLGRWMPIVALGFATGFAAWALRSENKTALFHSGTVAGLFISGCMLALAAVIELLVQRQRKFVARAVATEVIIDELRPLSWAKSQMTAQYHFFTEDRRVISACCAVGENDRDVWSNGSRVKAIYDPIRPARHAFAARPLWAIEWSPVESNDEAFDQAVAAMIAINPRRAA